MTLSATYSKPIIEYWPADFNKGDLAHFVEGLLLGVTEQEFSDLVDCIEDAEKVGLTIVKAAGDFKEENYDGVKKGLAEIGKAVV